MFIYPFFFFFIGEWSLCLLCIVCYIHISIHTILSFSFFFFCSIVMLKNHSFFLDRFDKNLTYISSFSLSLFPSSFLFVLHLFFHSDICVWGWSSLQQTIWVRSAVFLFFYFYFCETKMRYNKQNVYGNVESFLFFLFERWKR